MKIVYKQDVVFREVKYVPKKEFLTKKEEPEKIDFDLDDATYESMEEDELEEEEHHTPILRISMRERRQP
jgi:hypothetical protein